MEDGSASVPSLEDIEQKLIELLEISSKVMTQLSSIDSKQVQDSARLCKRYAELLQEIQAGLSFHIRHSPPERNYDRVSYAEYHRLHLFHLKSEHVLQRLNALALHSSTKLSENMPDAMT